ncbi:MAG: hypothetical protein ACYCW6_19605 [Candidatus Xenobia bacterium]
MTNVTSYAGVGSASAQVAQARSSVTQASRGVTTARDQVDIASSRLEQAQAQVQSDRYDLQQAEVLYQQLVSQATMFACVDTFRSLGVLALLSVTCVLLLRRVEGKAPAGGH